MAPPRRRRAAPPPPPAGAEGPRLPGSPPEPQAPPVSAPDPEPSAPPAPEPQTAPTPEPQAPPAPAQEAPPAPKPKPQEAPQPPATPEPQEPTQFAPLAVRSTPAPPATATVDPDAWSVPGADANASRTPIAQEVLASRIISRVNLTVHVPEALRLRERLELLLLDARLTRVPAADLVALAVDVFLRGLPAERSALGEPWSEFTGSGTPDVPDVRTLLGQRFIERTPLRASVPADLDLPHRIESLRLRRIGRTVTAGDIVAVAVDRYLRTVNA